MCGWLGGKCSVSLSSRCLLLLRLPSLSYACGARLKTTIGCISPYSRTSTLYLDERRIRYGCGMQGRVDLSGKTAWNDRITKEHFSTLRSLPSNGLFFTHSSTNDDLRVANDSLSGSRCQRALCGFCLRLRTFSPLVTLPFNEQPFAFGVVILQYLHGDDNVMPQCVGFVCDVCNCFSLPTRPYTHTQSTRFADSGLVAAKDLPFS